MTIRKNAMGSGIAAQAASALVGGLNTATAATGSTFADATLLPMSSNHLITTAVGSGGVILPPGNGSTDGLQSGDYMRVFNQSGQTILVYAPAGGKINNGSTNAGLTLTNNKNAEFVSLGGINFAGNLTA